MNLLAALRLLVIAALLLGPLPAAWAHAQLLSSDPVDGTVLPSAPPAVTLRFNEPVKPLAIRLIGPDAIGTDLLTQTSGGAAVEVTLPAALAQGTQVLSWRVVSLDGHPIGGALVFSIGSASAVAAQIATTDVPVDVALWASKALLFVALFIGIGGAAFTGLAPLPAAARRVAIVLCLAGLLLGPLTLGLQGLDALGVTLGALIEGTSWQAGLSTSYGATAITLTLAFAVAVAALRLPPGRLATGAGVLAATIAALSLALSGHASAAEPQWLTRPAVFLHLGGILFWVGALLPLWLLLRNTSPVGDAALARFSRGIPFGVAPLVVSGLVLAAIQLGWPGQQWLSPYAAILLAKLALLIVVFALALWNRFALTKPALAGEVGARQSLRRSIVGEIGLILLIVGLVAGWRFTPPPRALAQAAAAAEAAQAAAAEPITTHLLTGADMAMLTLTPVGRGRMQLELTLMAETGEVLSAQSVRVSVAAPQLGIEPIARDAVPSNDGSWLVDDLTMPLSGTWSVELDVRVSTFKLQKFTGAVEIP